MKRSIQAVVFVLGASFSRVKVFRVPISRISVICERCELLKNNGYVELIYSFTRLTPQSMQKLALLIMNFEPHA